MAKIKQFKGYGNFRGLIYGIENAKAEFEKAVEAKEFKGKYVFKNGTMTKLNLRIKTSVENTVFLELISFNSTVDSDVYLFSTDKDNKEQKIVPWKDRYKYGTSAEDKKSGKHGFEVIGVKMRGGDDEETVNLLTIDAMKYLLMKFKDGDSVFVSTEISHSESGDKKYTANAITKLFLTTDPIELESDEHEEISDFRDVFVFSEIIDLEDTSLVTGKWLDYRGEFVDVDYVVEDKDVSDYIEKNVSSGTKLTIEGIVHNRVVYKETEANELPEDDKPLVGSRSKSFTPKNFNKEIESEKKYYEITGIMEVLEGAYSEEELSGSQNSTNEKKEKLPWEMA